MDSSRTQALRALRDAERVLILGPRVVDGDSLGADLALHLALQKMGKQITSYSAGAIPPMYAFLPHLDLIQTKLSAGRDFVISLDTTQTLVERVRFQQVAGKLHLIVTPKGGSFAPEDIAFSLGAKKYDLIITVDSGDLGMFGAIREDHPEIFRETPILNIDHHPDNQHFGHINLVDLTAAATTEIVFDLLQELATPERPLMDADIATCVLNGLIYDTGSFQHSNTTPRSLELAAELVGSGARQQDIIKYLFKTKKLETLKLWGLALSKLRYDQELRLVSVSLTREDFTSVGADEIGGLIDELLSSAPEADFVMILMEKADGSVKGSLRAIAPTADVAAMSSIFGGGGHPKAAGFRVMGTLAEREGEIMEKLRLHLARHGEQHAAHADPLSPLADPALLPIAKESPLG